MGEIKSKGVFLNLYVAFWAFGRNAHCIVDDDLFIGVLTSIRVAEITKNDPQVFAA